MDNRRNLNSYFMIEMMADLCREFNIQFTWKHRSFSTLSPEEQLASLRVENYHVPQSLSEDLPAHEVHEWIKAAKEAFQSEATATTYLTQLFHDLQLAIMNYVEANVAYRRHCTAPALVQLMQSSERMFTAFSLNKTQTRFKNNCKHLLEHIRNIVMAAPFMLFKFDSLLDDLLAKESDFDVRWVAYEKYRDPNITQSTFEYLTGYDRELQTFQNAIDRTVANAKRIQSFPYKQIYENPLSSKYRIGFNTFSNTFGEL